MSSPSSLILKNTRSIRSSVLAPTAGGPGGQLAPGAVAVPGQMNLMQPQQPSFGQQPLELPSKMIISALIVRCQL